MVGVAVMARYHKAILIVAVVGTLCLMVFGSALAMPEYAIKFKVPCTFCHTKVPDLNEFGASFLKDNPTPPEMKSPRKIDKNMPSQGSEKPGVVAGDAAGDNDAKDKPTQVVEPPPPTPVYSWVNKDGIMVFTDNPMRVTASHERKKTGTGTRKPVVTKPVVAKRGHRLAKQVKVQPPVSAKRQDYTTQPGVSAVRYRSYGDCMEKILLTRVKPANADEAMGFILEAEETCQRLFSTQ